MNAKEARANASSIQAGTNKKQYEEIQRRIKEASDKGELEANVYFTPTKWVINMLETEGFHVNTTDTPRNEVITTITW